MFIHNLQDAAPGHLARNSGSSWSKEVESLHLPTGVIIFVLTYPSF